MVDKPYHQGQCIHQTEKLKMLYTKKVENKLTWQRFLYWGTLFLNIKSKNKYQPFTSSYKCRMSPSAKPIFGTKISKALAQRITLM